MYDPSTWEPTKFIDDLTTMEKFQQPYPEKPGWLGKAGWEYRTYCNIMSWGLNGTLEEEEWFQSGREAVYKAMLFVFQWFPFVLA